MNKEARGGPEAKVVEWCWIGFGVGWRPPIWGGGSPDWFGGPQRRGQRQPPRRPRISYVPKEPFPAVHRSSPLGRRSGTNRPRARPRFRFRTCDVTGDLGRNGVASSQLPTGATRRLRQAGGPTPLDTPATSPTGLSCATSSCPTSRVARVPGGLGHERARYHGGAAPGNRGPCTASR